MLNPAQRARAQRRKSIPQSVSAALKGWNTRDPFEAMDPMDAILLDNWFPDFGGLVTRGGCLNYATALGASPVLTLAPFRSSSINKFLAACGDSIFDISSGGPAGVAVKSGFTSATWQVATFNSRQFWVNGSDPAQIYDGTTMSATGFSGANMGSMNNVGVFNNRLYFWTGVEPAFWYGPVLGIAGALSKFDLSMVSREGGNLIAVEVLSYDGGTGLNDYTCFFLSSGECLMYAGTDPSNPNNWDLIGRYLLPTPVSSRGIARYGGDVYIITANDHQQLSKLFIAVKLGETPPRSKISGAARAAYQVGSNLPGWQALYYPAGTRVVFNIPNPDGSFSQHIFNTSRQAWCRYRNWNAHCFGIYNDALYFGTANGIVVNADVGSTDNGQPILAQAQQAWQLFDSPLKKRIALVRPVVQSQGISDFNFAIGFDYQPAGISIPDSTVSLSSALIWGATNWGSPHLWSGSGVTDSRWRTGGGEGAAVGLALTSNTKIAATWIRTDFMIEPGSAL